MFLVEPCVSACAPLIVATVHSFQNLVTTRLATLREFVLSVALQGGVTAETAAADGSTDPSGSGRPADTTGDKEPRVGE